VSADEASLSTAVIVWTGWGECAWPSRDEARVVRRFGPDLASMLLPQIRQLENDFYASDARDKAQDLHEIGDLAAAQFRGKHPEVSEEAVEALAWCYTYDYA
jgi:hypothetical protein